MKRFAVSLLVLALLVSITGCGYTNTPSATPSAKPEKSGKVIAEDLSQYFTGYEGCFVLFDQNKNEYYIYNQPKSERRVSPCSTFKIINSLIGLETEVLKDENTTFRWYGQKYPIESWNKDQTLKSAVADSVVWYFQEVAAQVGQDKMQAYLNEYNYGNKDISGGLTSFWLQSSLKISPREQVEILKKLYYYQLSASKENIDIVKNVIVLSNENGVKLSGKTGGGVSSLGDKYVNGWFVGYVEKNKNVYFFAANIEADAAAEKSASGKEAREITLKILKDKKLL